MPSPNLKSCHRNPGSTQQPQNRADLQVLLQGLEQRILTRTGTARVRVSMCLAFLLEKKLLLYWPQMVCPPNSGQLFPKEEILPVPNLLPVPHSSDQVASNGGCYLEGEVIWTGLWHVIKMQFHFVFYHLFIFFWFKFIYFNWRLITLQYCIGFAIHLFKCGRILSIPLENSGSCCCCCCCIILKAHRTQK